MKIYLPLIIALGVVLSSCGGGGGGASTPTAPPVAQTYPLQKAFAAYFSGGNNVALSASGTFCSPSAELSFGPATAATFNNTAAEVVVQTLAAACTPPLLNVRMLYFDADFAQLGFSIVGGLSGVAEGPATLPTSVSAGQSGTLATYAVFADESMTMPAGTLKETYAVSAESAGAVQVTLTRSLYNVQSTLTEVASQVFSLSSAGALNLVSVTDNDVAAGKQYTLSAT